MCIQRQWKNISVDSGPGRCICNVKTHMKDIFPMHLCQITLGWMTKNANDDMSIFLQCNGLVPSGNKELSELILTQIGPQCITQIVRFIIHDNLPFAIWRVLPSFKCNWQDDWNPEMCFGFNTANSYNGFWGTNQYVIYLQRSIFAFTYGSSMYWPCMNASAYKQHNCENP